MKWRFDDLATFLQVMEAGSITAAATRLKLSKSVVSKRISDLEAALGVALFGNYHLDKASNAGQDARIETG